MIYVRCLRTGLLQCNCFVVCMCQSQNNESYTGTRNRRSGRAESYLLSIFQLKIKIKTVPMLSLWHFSVFLITNEYFIFLLTSQITFHCLLHDNNSTIIMRFSVDHDIDSNRVYISLLTLLNWNFVCVLNHRRLFSIPLLLYQHHDRFRFTLVNFFYISSIII